MPVVFCKKIGVHIWDRPHIKLILIRSHVHEDHLLPMKGSRQTYWSLLQEVWSIHINNQTHEMHSHNTRGTKQDNSTKSFQNMCLLMSTKSKQFSGIWYDLKNNTRPGTYNFPKTLISANSIFCWCKNTKPPCQTHAAPGAVTFVQGDNKGSKPLQDNTGQSFADVTCYHWQEMGYYTEKCLYYTYSTCIGSQSLQMGLTIAPQQMTVKHKLASIGYMLHHQFH